MAQLIYGCFFFLSVCVVAPDPGPSHDCTNRKWNAKLEVYGADNSHRRLEMKQYEVSWVTGSTYDYVPTNKQKKLEANENKLYLNFFSISIKLNPLD